MADLDIFVNTFGETIFGIPSEKFDIWKEYLDAYGHSNSLNIECRLNSLHKARVKARENLERKKELKKFIDGKPTQDHPWKNTYQPESKISKGQK